MGDQERYPQVWIGAPALQQRAGITSDSTAIVEHVHRVDGDVHQPRATAAAAKGKGRRRDESGRVLAVELLATIVFVVVASDAFTNAVEWLGARFDLTRSAAGAVVAAIGSSLPETIVAIVALLILRDPRSQAIGIGAVIGAPFMLGTVIFSLIGIVAFIRGKGQGRNGVSLSAPLAPTLFGSMLFVATFALVLAASFARSHGVHVAGAVVVLAAYGWYLAYHLRAQQLEAEPSPPPLRFAPRSKEPQTWLIVIQMGVALAITVVAARWFVLLIGQTASALSIMPFVVSLFLSPIATELPEATNVIMWMRRREDSLALANVLGAMMFQTTVACSIAMVATPWQLSTSAYAAGIATLLAVGAFVVVTLVRRRIEATMLVLSGAAYLGYILFIAHH